MSRVRLLLRLLLPSTLALLTGCLNPHVRAGRDALGRGAYPEAIEHYERATAELPEGERPRSELASAHRALAMAQVTDGACADAGAHFEVATALTSPLLMDFQQLYACDAAPKDTEHTGQTLDEAVELKQLERLVALGDRRARILRRLMHLAFHQGDDEAAVRHVRALERRFALILDDHRKLAAALLRLDRALEAEPHLLHVVEAEPTDALSRLQIAAIRETRGEVEGARRMYTALTVDFHQNPVVFLRLAAFERRQGEGARAQRAQTRADGLRGVMRQKRKLRPLRKSKR